MKPRLRYLHGTAWRASTAAARGGSGRAGVVLEAWNYGKVFPDHLAYVPHCPKALPSIYEQPCCPRWATHLCLSVSPPTAWPKRAGTVLGSTMPRLSQPCRAHPRCSETVVRGRMRPVSWRQLCFCKELPMKTYLNLKE